MDKLKPAQRSDNMRRIRGANTKPELFVRSLLHRAGFRFRIHSRKLPGKPDIFLPKHKTILFVHGCFWHRHRDCIDATLPKTRRDFWAAKLEGNRKRDERVAAELISLGMRVITVWECETKHPSRLEQRLRSELATNV